MEKGCRETQVEPLAPQKVYVTVDVREDARALARAERMAAAMDGPPIEWVDEDRLSVLVTERGWDRVRNTGELSDPHDPDVVFTTGKFAPPGQLQARAQRWPALSACDEGHGPVSQGPRIHLRERAPDSARRSRRHVGLPHH